ALAYVHERELDIPLIIVSGASDEEIAVLAMRQGAADYLLKDRLARLGSAVAQVLEQKRLRDEKRRAEAREHEYVTRLQALCGRLAEAQEAERKLLAADLHDSVVQELSATIFRIEVVRRLLANGDERQARRELAEIESALQYSIRELRSTIARLYSMKLRRHGLVVTLDQHVEQWRVRTGVGARLDVIGEPRQLPLPVKIALYRIQ
ncbi:MAG: histidine kinase, partial [Candidatus Binatia bacterium]